jgi:DNA invertase Pin-like site-specific DNA recombinase
MTADHDLELDALLRAARTRFLKRSDASFDFDAGLADVYERAVMADVRAALSQADLSLRAEDQAEQRRRARRRRDDGGRPGHRSVGGS